MATDKMTLEVKKLQDIVSRYREEYEGCSEYADISEVTRRRIHAELNEMAWEVEVLRQKESKARENLLACLSYSGEVLRTISQMQDSLNKMQQHALCPPVPISYPGLIEEKS